MDTISSLNAALDGRYSIEREVGHGGMAVVYLARDVRHDRQVAVKVLHPDLAAALGSDRFLSEIKTTANLQHPHILPLHDSGEADGFLFYVMPFVAGETLRARLDRETQLPIDDALRIARETLSALDYAHRHGVVHRDIKPENILLHDGSALVADFGIALAVTAAGGQRMTQTGLSLGTPQYMSPEQAMGERLIDGRADIYATAAVLYEMLTGEPPFSGATVQAIVAKVMTERPMAPRTVRDTVPPSVESAVLRGLAKLPADRFASAAQFSAALDAAAPPPGIDRAPIREDRRWRVLAAVGFGLAAIATTAALVDRMRAPAAQRVERYDLTALGIQAGATPDNALANPGRSFALSDDGSRIAYIARDSARVSRVWVRDLDNVSPRPVAGTEGALALTLAPDGSAVAFIVGGSLRRVPVDGGAAPTILVSGNASGPYWADDGYIYFTVAPVNTGIRRIAAAGGVSDSIVSIPETAFRDVSVLPGSHALLAFVSGKRAGVAVASMDGKGIRMLLDSVRDARYDGAGHLVYVKDGAFMAAPFDLRALRITGPAVSMAEGNGGQRGASAQLALSKTGSLLYTISTTASGRLAWVGRNGKAQLVDSAMASGATYPALSPDGKRVAYRADTNIWVKELDRGPARKLTLSGSPNYPSWTADGRSVSFYVPHEGRYSLWIKPADGSGQARMLVSEKLNPVESVWSPDGQWLVFRTSALATGGDIYAQRIGADSTPTPLIATKASEMQPALSPDGKWLAYASDETGTYEVYVCPFPNVAAARWPISTHGGSAPLWSKRGDELFFRDGNARMVAMAVSSNGATFMPGATRTLFSMEGYGWYPGHREWDVAPDGQRFLALALGQDADVTRATLVRNWVSTIEERMRKK